MIKKYVVALWALCLLQVPLKAELSEENYEEECGKETAFSEFSEENYEGEREEETASRKKQSCHDKCDDTCLSTNGDCQYDCLDDYTNDVRICNREWPPGRFRDVCLADAAQDRDRCLGRCFNSEIACLNTCDNSKK